MGYRLNRSGRKTFKSTQQPLCLILVFSTQTCLILQGKSALWSHLLHFQENKEKNSTPGSLGPPGKWWPLFTWVKKLKCWSLPNFILSLFLYRLNSWHWETQIWWWSFSHGPSQSVTDPGHEVRRTIAYLHLSWIKETNVHSLNVTLQTTFSSLSVSLVRSNIWLRLPPCGWFRSDRFVASSTLFTLSMDTAENYQHHFINL